jgi:hypothetical protein
MPAATLHLLALHAGTDPLTFVKKLQNFENLEVIIASRPRHIVIHPTNLDKTPLATQKWDLLVLLKPQQQNPPGNTSFNTISPIPSQLRKVIQAEYIILVGIPSKILSTFPTRDAELKGNAASIPLTGSLDRARSRSKEPSQNLEVSPQLLKFMDDLTGNQNYEGPVTMLNLLQFHFPSGKQNYYQYGQVR